MRVQTVNFGLNWKTARDVDEANNALHGDSEEETGR